ncbi:MAG: hypothetical protein ABR554_13380, partial [Pyrinomonadaceae bacterium]
MATPSRLLTWLTTSALLLSTCAVGAGAAANAAPTSAPADGFDQPSADNASGGKVSQRLRERARGSNSDERVQVVIQLKGRMSGKLSALLNSNGAHVQKELKNLGMAVVELPTRAVEELAAFDEISYVTPDDDTRLLGHVSRATGVDAAVAQTYSSISKLDGTGVGIAVV